MILENLKILNGIFFQILKISANFCEFLDFFQIFSNFFKFFNFSLENFWIIITPFKTTTAEI